jgi:hypothetical protein
MFEKKLLKIKSVQEKMESFLKKLIKSKQKFFKNFENLFGKVLLNFEYQGIELTYDKMDTCIFINNDN